MPTSGITVADIERFWSKVTQTDTCWLWTGTVTTKNPKRSYGQFYASGQLWRAARFSLAIYGIELVDGYEVDHICMNKLCVKPQHLELVTHQVNIQRQREHLEYCRHGHKLTEDNKYHFRYGTTMTWKCRKCSIETARNLRRR